MKTRFLVGLALLAACGGGGGGPGIHDIAASFRTALCKHFAECGVEPDATSCEQASTIDDTESLSVVAEVDAGSISYDAESAQQCIDQLVGVGCDVNALRQLSFADGPCNYLHGNLAAGAACFEDVECADRAPCTATTACDRSIECCAGTCGAPRPASGAIGAVCSANAPCASPGYCKASTGVCTAPITTPGAPCDSSPYACAAPQYCNLDFQTHVGTCRSPSASNATCDAATLIPCADERDFCSPTSKCERKAAIGSSCPTGVHCVDYANCTGGICVGHPKKGEACTAAGESCLDALTCTAGTCQLPAAGMVCL